MKFATALVILAAVANARVAPFPRHFGGQQPQKGSLHGTGNGGFAPRPTKGDVTVAPEETATAETTATESESSTETSSLEEAADGESTESATSEAASETSAQESAADFTAEVMPSSADVENNDVTPSPIIVLLPTGTGSTGFPTGGPFANKTASADGASITTITVQSTETHTITSCAATVTNCPTRLEDFSSLSPEEIETFVVTNTVVFTEITCPVSEVAEKTSSAKDAIATGALTGSTLTPSAPKETGNSSGGSQGSNAGEIDTTVTLHSTSTQTKTLTIPRPGSTQGSSNNNSGGSSGSSGSGLDSGSDGQCNCPAAVTVTVTAPAVANTVYVTVTDNNNAVVPTKSASSPVADSGADTELPPCPEYTEEPEATESASPVTSEDDGQDEYELDCGDDETAEATTTMSATVSASASIAADVTSTSASSSASATEKSATEETASTSTTTTAVAAEATGSSSASATVEAAVEETTTPAAVVAAAEETATEDPTTTTEDTTTSPSVVEIEETIIVTPVPASQASDY